MESVCRAEHIGSKTAVQVRSHAQKFFSKLEKQEAAGIKAEGVRQHDAKRISFSHKYLGGRHTGASEQASHACCLLWTDAV